MKLQDDHPLFVDVLLQFASVFGTEIAVEKHFDPRNVTSGGASWGSKIFLGSLSLAIFYGPLINYAVIRPLLVYHTIPTIEEFTIANTAVAKFIQKIPGSRSGLPTKSNRFSMCCLSTEFCENR